MSYAEQIYRNQMATFAEAQSRYEAMEPTYCDEDEDTDGKLFAELSSLLIEYGVTIDPDSIDYEHDGLCDLIALLREDVNK